MHFGHFEWALTEHEHTLGILNLQPFTNIEYVIILTLRPHLMLFYSRLANSHRNHGNLCVQCWDVVHLSVETFMTCCIFQYIINFFDAVSFVSLKWTINMQYTTYIHEFVIYMYFSFSTSPCDEIITICRTRQIENHPLTRIS